MIDRAQLAAGIYLRLLETHHSKTEQWLREEAVRLADEFVKHVGESASSKKRNVKT